MNRLPHPACLVTLACSLALTGCLGLSPKDDPVRYFVLRPAAPAPTSETTSSKPPVIGLRPITLPGYLQPSAIATRHGPSEIQYSRFHRWSEPLETGIQRVLGENLRTLLRLPSIRLDDWSPNTVEVVLRVAFERFETDEAGIAHVSARWTIETAAASPAQPRTGRLVLAQPAASTQPADTTEALSLALAELSSHLARNLDQPTR